MKRILLAIVSKDVKEIWRNRQILLPMILLPLTMTIFMPVMMILGLDKGSNSIHGMEKMIQFLPANVSFVTDLNKLFYVMLNFMFPSLFLMIPLMAGSIIGASSLVGEKERKTLETLLYTPVTLKELFLAKLMATFIPAYSVTLISFASFSVVINTLGEKYLQGMFFPNLKWLILIFWVSPAVILFGLSAMVIISAYASTFQGAQQLSGFIVLPFVFLITGQTAGYVVVREQHLLIFTPILLLVDYFLMSFAAGRLSYERLLE